MAFFYVHYVLIYKTVTSLAYVFVPLDFRPRKERAILAKYIQFNQPHAMFWLGFDVDRAGAELLSTGATAMHLRPR